MTTERIRKGGSLSLIFISLSFRPNDRRWGPLAQGGCASPPSPPPTAASRAHPHPLVPRLQRAVGCSEGASGASPRGPRRPVASPRLPWRAQPVVALHAAPAGRAGGRGSHRLQSREPLLCARSETGWDGMGWGEKRGLWVGARSSRKPRHEA